MQNREIKTVKLSNCEVDIVSFITWGEKEEIKAEITKGAKINSEGFSGYDTGVILEAKYKTAEICIKEIRESDKKIPFSKEWMGNLSIEDGDKLYGEIDKLSKKK